MEVKTIRNCSRPVSKRDHLKLIDINICYEMCKWTQCISPRSPFLISACSAVHLLIPPSIDALPQVESVALNKTRKRNERETREWTILVYKCLCTCMSINKASRCCAIFLSCQLSSVNRNTVIIVIIFRKYFRVQVLQKSSK